LYGARSTKLIALRGYILFCNFLINAAPKYKLYLLC